MAGFVDDMVAAPSGQLRRERADLARGSHARRFEVVSLILDSAPITTGRASTQLGYDLRRRHNAAVLWTDPRDPDQAALAADADALGPATRARQVLTVIASSSSVWAWLAADTDASAITTATAAHPAVRVAVGPIGAGIDGFRRSHFDAVATQRLMSRLPDLRVARFADVQLVMLAIQDEQRAREFVARTLGQLADADRELRDTLTVYIGVQFSAARAARALYTHRNTVLNRLQRAERRLPLPLAGHGLEVGAALEIAQWLGTQPGSATHAGDARTPDGGSSGGRGRACNCTRDGWRQGGRLSVLSDPPGQIAADGQLGPPTDRKGGERVGVAEVNVAECRRASEAILTGDDLLRQVADNAACLLEPADYQALHLAGVRELQKGGRFRAKVSASLVASSSIMSSAPSRERLYPVPCNRLSVPRFPPTTRPVA